MIFFLKMKLDSPFPDRGSTSTSFPLQDLSISAKKSLSDSENSQKALLQRLFPDVSVKATSGSSLEEWTEGFAKAVKEATQ